MGEVGNGCWGPDIVPDFERRRPDSSLLAESRLRAEVLSLANCCCLLPAIGNDNPRNLPLLATPTPHVRVVLYPAQSFPRSKHGVQYGLFLSQPTFSWVQVKQSFAAPVAGARRRFLRGVTGNVVPGTVGFWTSGTAIAIQVDVETRNPQMSQIQLSLRLERPSPGSQLANSVGDSRTVCSEQILVIMTDRRGRT